VLEGVAPLLARKDREAERQAGPEPVIDEDEALDLEPHDDEGMQEAQLEPGAEQAADDEEEVDDLSDFHNPFEGQPDPNVFLGGPSNKSVLTDYGGHNARCIYENIVRYLIG
ncbi:hypothetical protein A2U01_0062189, partial [Trifolium medium]|nr:hypothetical protein [Trifolium medium]